MEFEHQFKEEEIWEARNHFSFGKAPGLEGYTAMFLVNCRSIIKLDFCEVFKKFYDMN